VSARRLSPRPLTGILSDAYRRNHLARNSGWVIIATGVNGLLGLAFWAEATHAFSESTIGSASTVLAAMTFASTAALMGLGTTALQVLPRADDKTWSTAVNSVVAGGATAGLVAGVVTALVLPHVSSDHAFTSFADRPLVVLCVALGTSVLTIALLLDYVFTAERQAHYVVMRGATFGVLKLALLSALILLGIGSGPWLIFIWVFGSLVTSGSTLLWQIRRLGRPHRYSVNGVVQYIRKWFKVLILHHMTSLGSVMIPSLMPVLVVSRLGSVASAHFYVAWLLSSVLLTVSAAVAGNLLADLSYDDEPMAQKLRRASRLIATLLLPPIVLVAVLGRFVLRAFGSSYAAHSYGILLLFVVVAVPDAVTNVYVTVLRARHEPHKAAAMNIAMGVIALGGAWYLLGAIGVVGAAWAWALRGVGNAPRQMAVRTSCLTGTRPNAEGLRPWCRWFEQGGHGWSLMKSSPRGKCGPGSPNIASLGTHSPRSHSGGVVSSCSSATSGASAVSVIPEPSTKKSTGASSTTGARSSPGPVTSSAPRRLPRSSASGSSPPCGPAPTSESLPRLTCPRIGC
jgi:O-antigen/teichoic acid export membrane protein